VEGVSFQEKEYLEGRLRITTVQIRNEVGQEKMKKPMGNYVTLEFTEKNKWDTPERQEKTRERASGKLSKLLKKMLPEKEGVFLVAGLGNRFATPDALGPFVLDDIKVNRHVKNHLGEEYVRDKKILCAFSPGVMGQTGMETQEILEGITTKIKPCCLLVVDSLATRSVNRLCNTIQITDTGICPGAGIGNNRNQLNQETMKIPVVAIGVPTVVDAGTIVSECMEETLLREGYSMEQIDLFLRGLSRHAVERLFVTPKDIDEQIRVIGKVVANGINQFVSENII
jgi:spore protease